jgi:hypothetical protein
MYSKSNNQTHRDFIDFLLLLYRHAKIFFIALVLLLSFAIFFNYNQVPVYKFSVKIKAPASNDVFMPVIMYRDALRQASDEALTNKGNEFSSLGVDHLLSDLLQGGRLFPIIDNKLKESYGTKLNVRKFIEVERADGGFDIVVKSNDEMTSSKIRDNLMPLMQLEITRIYNNIIETHKTNTLNKIKSLIKSDTVIRSRDLSTELLISSAKNNEDFSSSDALKENAVYSPYNENFDYINNLKIPNLNLNYIYFVQSTISKEKTLPSAFIYLFSIFLSIFLFIFIVIILDLKNQVFLRKESQS